MTTQPLRDTLRKVLNAREAMWKKSVGNPRWDRIRVAMGKAEEFLRSYPYADNWRVIEWCHAHRWEVYLLVPSNRKETLARLMGKDATLSP